MTESTENQSYYNRLPQRGVVVDATGRFLSPEVVDVEVETVQQTAELEAISRVATELREQLVRVA